MHKNDNYKLINLAPIGTLQHLEKRLYSMSVVFSIPLKQNKVARADFKQSVALFIIFRIKPSSPRVLPFFSGCKEMCTSSKEMSGTLQVSSEPTFAMGALSIAFDLNSGFITLYTSINQSKKEIKSIFYINNLLFNYLLWKILGVGSQAMVAYKGFLLIKLYLLLLIYIFFQKDMV